MMAERLMHYYNYVYDEKGLTGKMMLAQKTKIPSVKAAMIADSPENIAIFKKLVAELTGKPAPDF
jgi:hypothetical protein